MKKTRLFRKLSATILSIAVACSQLFGVGTMTAGAEEGDYEVSVTSDSQSIKVGDTVNLTAVCKYLGEEVQLGEDYHIYWTVENWDGYSTEGTLNASNDVTTATFVPESTGDYAISVNLKSADWNTWYAYGDFRFTAESADPEEPGGDPEDGITISVFDSEGNPFDASSDTLRPGDSVSLETELIYEGEKITDLTEAGIDIWFWCDTYNHPDGSSNANISDNTGKTFSNSVTFSSEGTYYIVAEPKSGSDGLFSELQFVTFTVEEEGGQGGNDPVDSLTISVFDSEGNEFDFENDTLTAGDTVTLETEFIYGGETVTDLDAAGARIWFWVDHWNGHSDGSSDAVFSNYDNNSGLSLSADVTFASEGTYYIVAEPKTAGDSGILASAPFVTFTVEAAVPEEEDKTGYVTGEINVSKINNLANDFIMGMDISSVISELNSGVTYKDFDGNTISTVNEFISFLAECGITDVRVRVWNNPFDGSGHGYGGGNCDVNTCKVIADACRAAGIHMLVDFHCSDLWTDPGKYQAPKAWKNMSVAEKGDALKAFITDSLNSIDPQQNVITMVQVGNETTGGFIGVTDRNDMCSLFSKGAEGVKAYKSDVKVVIHVTNPEKSNMTGWAKTLDDNSVPYDILATSYYPYWHGTFANLKSQMESVFNTYGKETFVAETSYAYTLDDTDGHDNTVRVGNNDNGANTTEPFSVQGQANYLRNLMANVNETAGALGVFYWEPAWITVGDITGLTGDALTARINDNKEIWERCGSGWASSYAGEYDANDAGKWYGGSAVDNEAQFYPDGTPTAALHVWEYVKSGAISNNVSVDSIASCTETVDSGNAYTLPLSVQVTYNNGAKNESVTWAETDIAKIDVNKAGTYVVNGTVTFSENVNTGAYAGQTTGKTTYTLTVKEPNLISENDAEFASASNFTLTGSGIEMPYTKGDAFSGSSCMHWYYVTATQGTATYKSMTLAPGKYALEIKSQGFEGDKVTLEAVADDAVISTCTPAVLTGWNNWNTATASFSLSEETEVTIRIVVDIQATGWGTADCLYLYKTGNVTPGGNTSGDTPSGDNGNSQPSDSYAAASDYVPAATTSAVQNKVVLEEALPGQEIIEESVAVSVSGEKITLNEYLDGFDNYVTEITASTNGATKGMTVTNLVQNMTQRFVLSIRAIGNVKLVPIKTIAPLATAKDIFGNVIASVGNVGGATEDSVMILVGIGKDGQIQLVQGIYVPEQDAVLGIFSFEPVAISIVGVIPSL